MPENANRTIEFWSSVECAAFLRGLERELNSAGWKAGHRFATSEAAYRSAHGGIARVAMRWRSYVTYPLMLRRRLLRNPRPAVVVVCTNTFYAPAVAIRAARSSGIPIVHWVFDLFPDVLVQAGTLRPGGRLERHLAVGTRATLAAAAANVFLGEQLLAYASVKYGPVPRATVIPVGADGRPFRSVPPGRRTEGAPLRVLYCGHFGRMHETSTMADVLSRGLPVGCAVDFRGHGPGFATLAAVRTRSGAVSERVTFGPSVPSAEWVTTMQVADIALVTMQRDASPLVMPSKTYSAMVAGQAVLAVCPRESDLGRTVLQHDAGWVVEPGDDAGLATILQWAVEHPDAVRAKRANAFRAGHAHYDERTVARTWSELLETVVAGVAEDRPVFSGARHVSRAANAAIG